MEKQNPENLLPRPHVVLYPCILSMGHLFPFMDLATKLVTHHAFSVTIITAKPTSPSVAHLYTSYLQAFTSDEIRLLELPPPQQEEQIPNPLLRYLSSVEKSTKVLQDLVLQSCRQNASLICAFIVDFFNMAAVDAIAPLSIPTYLFTTSSAANLCLKFHLPKFIKENPDLRDSPDATIRAPGVWTMAIRDLPPLLTEKSFLPLANIFTGLCSLLPKLTGIFINSFAEMEEAGIRTAQQYMPRIYPIGPLLCSCSVESKAVQESGSECLRWLDNQPDSSVVYVSFGSCFSVTGELITELALGLERSGQRFLWVVRGVEKKPSDQGLGLHLPEGFDTRVQDRGLVVFSWALQIQILSHPAVGGFVSHCGWSSTLEGIWYAVPFACCPLQAEQRMNCMFIVNELQVGLEVKKSEDGTVKGDEVQRAVEELMGGEEGRRVRRNAKEWSGKARDAMEDKTGSSSKSLKAAAFDFISDLRK